ncbi:hypothetical protein ACHAQA_008104 [Verticillium albo-atrum]
MTDHYIQDFPNRAIQRLTAILTLPPQHGLARPTSGWLARQQRAVDCLPESCLRPSSNVTKPLGLMKRGLMKLTEKHSLPFVPDAAVLCQSHKNLHPWRIRSIFLLMASECGIRSDRIRRHAGFDGIPPSQNVQDFVYRMTNVSGLWVASDDFEARFGYRPDMFPQLNSGCEACMLSIVGARAQLLVDLRANMLARSKRGYEPSFMRFVDAWIEWFGDDASFIMAESRILSEELRQIRREMARRRHEKRRQARREGRLSDHTSRSREEKSALGYSIPRPPKRSNTVKHSRSYDGDVPPFPEALMSGARDGYMSGVYETGDPRVPDVSQGEREVEPPTPMTPMGNPFSDPEPNREDDEDESEETEKPSSGWATDVGSYYFSHGKPGARAGWGRARDDDNPARGPAANFSPSEWTDVTVRTERNRIPCVANLTRDAVEPNTPFGAKSFPVPSRDDGIALLRAQLERVNMQTAAPPTYAPSSVYSTDSGGGFSLAERAQLQTAWPAELYSSGGAPSAAGPPIAPGSRYAALHSGPEDFVRGREGPAAVDDAPTDQLSGVGDVGGGEA